MSATPQQKFSVAQRLAAGFGFVMLLVLAIASSAALSLNGISRNMNAIVDVNDARTRMANELLSVINDLAIESRNVALFTDLRAIDSELVLFEKSVAKYQNAQAALDVALSTDAADDPGRVLLKRIGELGASTLPQIKKAVSLGAEGSNIEANLQMTTKVRPAETEWRAKVAQFLSLQEQRTVASVAEARANTRRTYLIGATLVAAALISGTLVAWWVIRNNLQMVAVIAEQNRTLERRVEERTAQLRQKTNDIAAMLQNMSLGVCTVVAGNRIHPEYSRSLASIVESEDLADKPLLPTLFGRSDLNENDKDQIDVALASIIGEDPMMFDFNSHLLPREMVLRNAGSQRVVQLEWNAIEGSAGVVEKVLLILQDVTSLRALQLEAEQQREELNIIGRILKIPEGKFNEFIASARAFCSSCRHLIETPRPADGHAAVIANLFRNMHTIKGNARTFDFATITNAAHIAEETYDTLRNDPHAPWDPQQLLHELAAVEAAITQHARISDDKLGRKSRPADAMEARGVFLTSDQVQELQSAVHAATAEQTPADGSSHRSATQTLVSMVGALGLPPLKRIVAEAIAETESTAVELGKPLPSVEISGETPSFKPAFARVLKNCLTHIFRNTLDHGLESPEERVHAGKAERGLVRFDCTQTDAAWQLRVSDDGRGLALRRLLEKGVSSGLVATDARPCAKELAELIFHSGMSTASSVTQVSGRGVGMDAIRSFMRESGGDVWLELNGAAQPTMDYAPFTLVLDVPRHACAT